MDIIVLSPDHQHHHHLASKNRGQIFTLDCRRHGCQVCTVDRWRMAHGSATFAKATAAGGRKAQGKKSEDKSRRVNEKISSRYSGLPQ